LKPPHWLMAVTLGGVVMLKASTQIMLSYSKVLVREIRGSWSLGTPDPVWRNPHSVQYFVSVSLFLEF
jgi:hypothetical protein